MADSASSPNHKRLCSAEIETTKLILLIEQKQITPNKIKQEQIVKSQSNLGLRRPDWSKLQRADLGRIP